MSYSINPALWSKVFPIPTDICDKHIKLCSGVALKCLLLILRSPDEFGSAQALSKKLGQPVSEITDALNYWEEQGILSKTDGDAVPAFKPVAASEPVEAKPASAQAPQKPAVSAPSRPRYPRDEAIAIVNDDDTLRSLMQELQAILGKPLTSADTDVLVALYSFYGLSAHYILSLMHYCAAIGKRGMAYAEKVAVTWINDGVDDSNIDSHIDKLYSRRSNEGAVRHAFGISDRNLTTKEKEYIALWFDMGFDITMITYAYEITVDRTGKTVFSYTNKILLDWNKKGIKTLADAKAEAAPQNKTEAAPPQSEQDLKLIEQFMNN